MTVTSITLRVDGGETVGGISFDEKTETAVITDIGSVSGSRSLYLFLDGEFELKEFYFS